MPSILLKTVDARSYPHSVTINQVWVVSKTKRKTTYPRIEWLSVKRGGYHSQAPSAVGYHQTLWRSNVWPALLSFPIDWRSIHVIKYSGKRLGTHTSQPQRHPQIWLRDQLVRSPYWEWMTMTATWRAASCSIGRSVSKACPCCNHWPI